MLLNRAAEDLTARERHLLKIRFVDEMTQTEIAAVVEVNQTQVSRLLTRLMTKLRAKIGDLDEASDVR